MNTRQLIAAMALAAAVAVIAGGAWVFIRASIPSELDVRISLDIGAPQRIVVSENGEEIQPASGRTAFYLGHKHLGWDRVTVDLDALRSFGVEIPWSDSNLTTESDLGTLLREELGLPGARVGYFEPGMRWGVSLVDFERRKHRGLTAVVRLGSIQWLRPDGSLDSFFVLLVREHEAPLAHVGLVRARQGDRGALFTGHSGTGPPHSDSPRNGDKIVVDWTVAPDLHVFDLPQSGETWLNVIPGAERWWIAAFPEGEDLRQD